MKYIFIEKEFDVRTLLVLISSTEADIQDLIKRNVDRFRKVYIKNNISEIDNLNEKTYEYEECLTSKISATKQRLASTDNGLDINPEEAYGCFMRSVQSVKDSIRELHLEVPNEIKETFYDAFEYQKSEALMHIDMFISHYRSELEITDQNYLKSYVYIMIQHGYLFEYGEMKDKYSLLIFLSFYEAYAKRIVGLSLLGLDKDKLRILIEEKKYNRDNTFDEEAIEVLDDSLIQLITIFEYLEKTTRPMAKSCYFLELQKGYRGDITEFIQRFLIDEVREEHKVDYQKSTLIDKKMLRSGKCAEITDPPITLSTPPLIEEFFRISDSHYMIM